MLLNNHQLNDTKRFWTSDGAIPIIAIHPTVQTSAFSTKRKCPSCNVWSNNYTYKERISVTFFTAQKDIKIRAETCWYASSGSDLEEMFISRFLVFPPLPFTFYVTFVLKIIFKINSKIYNSKITKKITFWKIYLGKNVVIILRKDW